MNVSVGTVDIHSFVLPGTWVAAQYVLIVTMVVYMVGQIRSMYHTSGPHCRQSLLDGSDGGGCG
jgi:hypothetical protein